MSSRSGPGRPRRHRGGLRPLAGEVSRWRRRAGGRGGGAPGPKLALAQAAWREVGGAPVASQSVPVRLSRAGVLSVACSSASWAQELAARSDDLLARLSALTGVAAGVRGLRFIVSDGALPRDAAAPGPPPRPSPTAAQRAAARVAVGPVADPRLRDLLKRAAAARMVLEDRKDRETEPEDHAIGHSNACK